MTPKASRIRPLSPGAKVVMVFPVANSDDRISYAVLSNFDEMGRLLAELQAFMFWKVGVAAPPRTVGKTALSAFSSANYTLVSWLNSNGTSTFLKNNISAVYFLDPPGVDDCVKAGLAWRRNMGKEKRVRLYSARDTPKYVPAYRWLLGLDPKDPLASPAYLLDAADNRITLALFPKESWDPRQGRTRNRHQVDRMGCPPLRPGDRAHARARAGGLLTGARIGTSDRHTRGDLNRLLLKDQPRSARPRRSFRRECHRSAGHRQSSHQGNTGWSSLKASAASAGTLEHWVASTPVENAIAGLNVNAGLGGVEPGDLARA